MSGENPTYDVIYPTSFPEGEEGNIEASPETRASLIGSREDFGSLSRISGAGDCRVYLPPSRPSRIEHSGWIFPVPFVEYSPKLGARLLKRLARATRQWYDWDSAVYDELQDIEEPARSALHSFICDLSLYQKERVAGKRPLLRNLPVHLIAQRCLSEGPSFAKWLDGLKAFFVQARLQATAFKFEIAIAYESWKDDISDFIQNKANIGDLYRPNSLFPWVPPKMDPKGVVDTPVCISEGVIDEFRQAVQRFLEDPRMMLWKAPGWEFLQDDKTTKTNQGPRWATPALKGLPPKVRGTSKLAHIPRELKEQRWAVVEDYDSLVTIRWINKAVDSLIDLDRRNLARSQPETVSHKLRKAFLTPKNKDRKEGCRVSYCRDFRKEGLTKPRILLRIMLEELSKTFPHEEVFTRNIGFFDHWNLVDEDKVPIPNCRGHGLGMAVQLTTLMQIVIEIMCIGRNAPRPYWSGYVNDDAALIFEDCDEANTYAAIDRSVCKDLSLDFKEKGSFIAQKGVVLCEQYAVFQAEHFNARPSFAIASVGILRKAINASHARSLANALNCENIPQWVVPLICSYWAPVLQDDEARAPRCLGGWFRSVSRGIDLDFEGYLGHQVLGPSEHARYRAYQEVSFRPNPWKRLSKDKKLKSLLPRKLYNFMDVGQLDAGNTFVAREDSKENVRAWKSYEAKLKKTFLKYTHQKRSGATTWYEVWKQESDRRPTEDILPPQGVGTFVKSKEVLTTADVEFSHPYSRQRIDLLRDEFVSDENSQEYLAKTNYHQTITLSFKKDAAASKARYNNAAGRAIFLRRGLWSDRRELECFWNAYIMPPEETMSCWNDPFSVARAVDTTTRDYVSLMLNEEEMPKNKADLIKTRYRSYGRELKPDEWMIIGSIRPGDQILVRKLRNLWDSDTIEGGTAFDRLTILVDFCRKYPGLGSRVGHLKMTTPNDLESFRFLMFQWGLLYEKYNLLRREERERRLVIREVANLRRPTGPSKEKIASVEEIEKVPHWDWVDEDLDLGWITTGLGEAAPPITEEEAYEPVEEDTFDDWSGLEVGDQYRSLRQHSLLATASEWVNDETESSSEDLSWM